MPNVMNLKAQQEQIMAQLRQLRQQSLQATRRGDYRRVAQLTLETVRVNALLESYDTSDAERWGG